ncbi:MAG: NADH-quinone oxidoreductase subunit NuoE [Chloroflexi bacterium]|nr:NADH-quinone oxidoreductase subunit NuoE [Chloroflexota bacterium]
MKEKIDALLSTSAGTPEDLIPLLQAVQQEFGYVPEEAIFAISQKTGISPSQVFGTLTFYAQFRLHPQGRNVIKVCRGTACHVRGGPRLLRTLTNHLDIDSGETTPDLEFSIEEIGCFGSCSLAPVVVVNEDTYGRLTPEKALQIVESYRNNGQNRG